MKEDIYNERLRVLVIDDSLVIRALIEELMDQEKDCRVVGAASNVPMARSMISDLLPNVITLDLNMPDIGGIAFLDELRDQKHPPVVVVSSAAYAASQASEEAIEHGASACFDKAKIVSDRDDFLQTLKQAVKRQHDNIRQAAIKSDKSENDIVEVGNHATPNSNGSSDIVLPEL